MTLRDVMDGSIVNVALPTMSTHLGYSLEGSHPGNLLVPLVAMEAGLGLLYAGMQTAANAGVPEDQAGLAAALITASFQLGSALGLAVFSAIATSCTSHLPAIHTRGEAAAPGEARQPLEPSYEPA